MNLMTANYSDPEMLKKRLAGILPCIIIGDHEFIVMWKLRELRAADDQAVKISLRDMTADSTGENYLCFYNTRLRKVVHVQQDIDTLPPDTVMLAIPNELSLDPVEVAREYGQDDLFFLYRHPIRKTLRARVFQLCETGLPALIKANIEKTRKKDHGH